MANRPKLELKSNIPETVHIKYVDNNPKDYGYGPTYRYVVTQNGEEKTLFLNERQYEEIKDYKSGDVVILLVKEEKNEAGKTYKHFTVRPALLDERGEVVQPRKDIVNNEDARKEYRERRIRLLAEAIEDTFRARRMLLDAYGKFPEIEEEIRAVFTPEVIQDFATTLLISEDRRA